MIKSLLIFFISAIGLGGSTAWGKKTETFTHDLFDSVLTQHVNELGRVDYSRLQKNPEDLNAYLRLLSETSPDSHPKMFPTHDHELAYWMNAYNAFVLKGVIDHYPIESVRKVKLFYGFFWHLKFRAGGRSHTLHEIENKIIRERYKDPRIHFAINCASLGCPRLPQKAFRAEDLDSFLDDLTKEFVSDPEKVEVTSDSIRLSKIFEWYKDDFLDYLKNEYHHKDPTLVDYLEKYLPAEEHALIKGKKIKFMDYDWGLNDQK